MTANQSAFTLGPDEWRRLLVHNSQIIAEFATNNGTVTNDQIAQMLSHLDRLKIIALAWQASMPAGNVAVPTNGHAPHDQVLHDAVKEPKRKGGWPKGKKRLTAKEVTQ